MGKLKRNFQSEGVPGFPWDMYKNGFNGTNLVINDNVNAGDAPAVCYSHEPYAQEYFNILTHQSCPVVTKDINAGAIVAIDDLHVSRDGNLIADINHGMGSITIDLNKEDKFLNLIDIGGEKVTKEVFAEMLKEPKFKESILAMDLKAKVTTDTEKASLWNGYVEGLYNEMSAQITENSKAYHGVIVESNNGGFTVEISGCIKAFMPGSMAAANKITDYQSYVGTETIVMVESYNPKTGFIVSHKKYLRTILPMHIENLRREIAENADKVYKGVVTGTTAFGIFIELTPVLTGMLHKTLISDELRNQLREGNVEPGTEIDVYVHKIDDHGRIILSNVPSAEREEVIERREAEEAAAVEMLKKSGDTDKKRSAKN